MSKRKNPIIVPMWVETMILMKQGHGLLEISKIMWATYSHIHNIAKNVELYGWVTKEKVGRTNKYTFTEKGDEVVKACEIFLYSTRKYIEPRGKKSG